MVKAGLLNIDITQLVSIQTNAGAGAISMFRRIDKTG
jgi:hypothetical protein